jgi:hypothetical protein
LPLVLAPTYASFVKQWGVSRQSTPDKLLNHHYIKSFASVAFTINPAIQHLDYAYSKKGVWFNEGTPAVSLFTVSKDGEYINSFPTKGLWKNQLIDYSIVESVLDRSFNKYKQPCAAFVPDKPYDLFLCQIMGRDWKAMYLSLHYANKHRKYTLYKKHNLPATDSFSYYWDYFNKLGLITEYTVPVTDYDTSELIKNAKLVYSHSSGGNMLAAILGVPTATYGSNYYSELIPTIKNLDTLDSIESISKTSLYKYLTWFFINHLVDMHDKNFANKFERLNHLYKE